MHMKKTARTKKTDEDLTKLVVQALTALFSDVSGVGVENLLEDEPLETYGINSLMITMLNQRLSDLIEGISSTLFFEHGTLRDVAGFLVAARPDDCAGWVGAKPRSQRASPTANRRQARLNRRAPGASEPQPIAIVGRAGRFPGASDLDTFWANLRDGVDSICDIPADRWDWRKFYGDPQEPNKTNVKSGGFIEGLDEFDPLFFRMSPREANLSDPQQRLLMTYVWRVIEDAGYAPSALSGSRTAIFVGMCAQGEVDSSPDPDGDSTEGEGHGVLRNSGSLAPNRVSYFLNLRGPSELIDTTCASGLVAIHRAVLALRHEACDMVIAGGVNAIIYPTGHISLSKVGILSQDGRCKAFSATADGYGRGEGIGVLVLKRLGDAERDGDHIYAVIRGSAVNHGGRGNSFTAPNPSGQAEVIKIAHRQAALDPHTISYIEAHGTGTPLGDPIEIDGLVRAFNDLSAASKGSAVGGPRCAIGSVKSNIGHLEYAAGIAGLMKILMQLEHRTIAKSLHCDVLNPHVRLDGTPFFIARETMPWTPLSDADGEVLPRRAGVSSFGIGGVNAHVVIEEYVSPEQPARMPPSAQRPALIVLTAKSEPKLREQASQLLAAVRTGRFDDLDLPAIAYTLQVGRDAFDHRLAWPVASIAEFERTLEQAIAGAAGPAEIHRGRKSPAPVGDKRAHDSVASWIAGGAFDKLLGAWVQGVAVDWRALYGHAPPRRVSLPTYPFSRERYAIGTSSAAGPAARGKAPAKHSGNARPATAPHPLVQSNTSDLTGQRFTSVFDGHEGFLAEHVSGARVLTPAAYIEMIRAAIAAAIPAVANKSGVLRMRLSDHAWLRPLLVGPAATTVHVSLDLTDRGEIAYSVYSTRNSSDDEEVAHAEGHALLRGATEISVTLDVDALRSRCDPPADADNLLAGRRADWLAGAVEAVHSGRDAQGCRFMLARVTVPETLQAARDAFCVHPVLLGAAMEMGVEFLRAEADRSLEPAPNLLALRGAVDEVAILAPVPPRAWAYVRPAAANGSATSALNLDVCDDSGCVAVRFRGWELGSSADRSFAPWDRLEASSAAGARLGNH
jgi:polyketide synthase PksN